MTEKSTDRGGGTILLKIHHGGHFNLIPLKYVGGKVNFVYDYDEDKLSYFELRDVVNDWAAKPTVKLYFKQPDEIVEFSPKLIKDDKDMVDLLSCRRDLGPVEVYALDAESAVIDTTVSKDPNAPMYEEDLDDDEDRESIASLDHLSDCEEEVTEVRLKAMERKKKPASEDKDQETVVEEEDSDSSDEDDVLEVDEDNVVEQSETQACEGEPSGSQPNVTQHSGVEKESNVGVSGVKKIKKATNHKKVRSDSTRVNEPDQSHDPNSTSTYQHDPFLTQLCTDFDASKYVDVEVDSDDENMEVFVDSEDEELRLHKNDKWPIHNPKTPWKKMRPYHGERYANPEQLKHCLLCYSVRNGHKLQHVKGDTRRLRVRCLGADKKCPWKLHASWMQDERSFQIKSFFDKHTCVKDYTQKLVNHDWIATMLASRIRQNPTWNLLDMRDEVKEKYKITVSTNQCYRAKRRVLDEVEGCLKEHYALLWNYADEICRSNPGLTVKMKVNRPTEDSPAYFQRFYVCLNAVKKGWIRGCRKFIGLDGAFLKTVCKGQLFAAVGRDANNHVFPIAWAVVEAENRDSRGWFLELLIEDLGLTDGSHLAVMSDGQKGLIGAVQDLLPEGEHRRCARHIYANFRKKWNGVLMRNLFWEAAKTRTETKFIKVMNKIKALSKEAYEYLTHKDRDPKTWCRAYFRFDACVENVENNSCECFNSYVLEARKKPIITMLEEIRILTMDRMKKMKIFISKNEDPDGLLKVPRKRLEQNKDNQRFWKIKHNGEHGYEAKKGDDGFSTDVERRTCACREWGLTGIPCEHACGAISALGDRPEKYVSKWYLKESFIKTYEEVLQPMNGVSLWRETGTEAVLPPRNRRVVGRPKGKRRREEGEDGARGSSKEQSTRYENNITREGRRMQCQNCLEYRHNKLSCKNEHREKPVKEKGKPGRPKKNSVENNQVSQDNPIKESSRKRPAKRQPQKSHAGQSKKSKTILSHVGGVLYDEETGSYFIGNSAGDRSQPSPSLSQPPPPPSQPPPPPSQPSPPPSHPPPPPSQPSPPPSKPSTPPFPIINPTITMPTPKPNTISHPPVQPGSPGPRLPPNQFAPRPHFSRNIYGVKVLNHKSLSQPTSPIRKANTPPRGPSSQPTARCSSPPYGFSPRRSRRLLGRTKPIAPHEAGGSPATAISVGWEGDMIDSPPQSPRLQ